MPEMSDLCYLRKPLLTITPCISSLQPQDARLAQQEIQNKEP